MSCVPSAPITATSRCLSAARGSPGSSPSRPASELGDITRFPTPVKFVGYTGLCPRVDQSGQRDWRGPLRKNGPNYLRWALVEAAHTALRHPCYEPVLARQTSRHGRKRGRKIATIEVARKLAEAIWWMLIRQQPFAPAGAVEKLTA